MKFGVREICDVVLKAKAAQKIGNKIFYKNEPVLYFDTLTTSTLEGASTTVYAQGGRGNSRLVAWEGERTVTFNMEDALISPEGFMILSGAGLVEANGVIDEESSGLIADIKEFREFTGNSFKGMVHPDDYAKIDNEILAQIFNRNRKIQSLILHDSCKNNRLNPHLLIN